MNDIVQKWLVLDDDYSSRMRLHPQRKIIWRLAAFMAHSGDPWYWVLLFGLTWYFGDAAWRYRSIIFEVGIGGLGLVILILKYIFRRSRPPGEWGAIYRKTDPHSFPSGHAARSALLALMGIFLGPWWLALILVLHAPMVIFSRVMTGVHYLSDVIAGTIVGFVFGGIILLSVPLIQSWFPFLF